MIWDASVKSKFSVYVLCSNTDQGVAIKTAIAQDGFDAYLFSDAEVLYHRIKDTPPHLVVLCHGSLSVPMEDFVQEVVNINSEVRFLSVAPITEMQNLLRYRPYNFSPTVIEGEGLYSRIVWSVDEICQALYLTYQNEQVYSLAEKAEQESAHLRQEIKEVERKAETSAGVVVGKEISVYSKARNKDDVLSLFLRELNQKFLTRNKKAMAVYFKFLPSVGSFVATQALGFDIDSLKGVGGRLNLHESQDPAKFLNDGGIPQDLQALLAEGLKARNPHIRAIFVQGHVDGFFVLWGNQCEIYNEEFENEFALFNLVFERSYLSKKLASLDLSDQVTELFGRQYYLKHLADEVARARRLQKAVSLVKMSVDHLPELQQTLGPGGRDQILRAVATVIKKTSRVNDISCRTADNEFTLILPHAARKGGSLRAERLRRMIEVKSESWTGSRFTVSCSVSEYPTHSTSADDLEKAASQALEFVASKGGNKVCLFQPSEAFRPDYDVPPL
jgi:diguanylate cyclase (GGDEF)-like protein